MRTQIIKTFLLGVLFLPLLAYTQSYRVDEASRFVVAGTSTLHDWEMVSDEGRGEAAFKFLDGEFYSIESLEVALKGESLKSGKEKMDNNAYEALETDENPFIRFDLSRVIAIENDRLRLKGDFSAGGKKKTEIIEVQVEELEDSILLTGSFDITFTEYDMEPPSALMGTINTGNELTISFEARFKN